MVANDFGGIMEQYFVRDYTGGSFVLFGAWHLGFIGLFVLLNIFIILSRKRLDLLSRKKFRYGLAIASIVVESSWHIWSAVVGLWNIREYLPLHLCSIFVILNSIMLFTRSYRIYEYSYFLGIAGALQAFLTPDAGIYGLPHFRAVQTLLAHGLLITEGIYMTIVEGFRPTWGSIKRVMIGANIYMAFVGLVNWLLGSNYMFIAHKPETASLLDMLGPWPWYILSLEVVGLLMCLILYIPFIIKDAFQKQPKPARAGE
jgi:hypothetical integral membrane protein (TIGR02206 family)